MAAVLVSTGQLVSLERARAEAWAPTYSLQLYNLRRSDYAAIYRTQPNLRMVVGFIARNVAQIGFHLFERVSDNDRQRRAGHPFELALKRPNPVDRRMTRSRLVGATIQDLAVFDEAFWAVVDVGTRIGFVRLPAKKIKTIGKTDLWPDGYEYHGSGGVKTFTPNQVVHFLASLSPDSNNHGEPPIETIRRLLAEEAAAGEYREQFWRRGARLSGVITRPPTAPDWSPGARERFKRSFREVYTGDGPDAGGTPLLEDGMTWAAAGINSHDAQYVEARQLTRDEVAAYYGIDPAFVGSQKTAAEASLKERRKALYMDALAPWAVAFAQDLEAQALPHFLDDPERADDGTFYVEPNIAEKLRGSIEDMADAVVKLVGRPILEANEGRALFNRNALPEGEGLTIPLNVLVGGQVDPGEAPPGAPARETARGLPGRKALPRSKANGIPLELVAELRAAQIAAHLAKIAGTFERQRAAVASKIGAGATTIDAVWDAGRWDDELTADLFALAAQTATAYGTAYAAAFGLEDFELDEQLPYLAENSRIAAENINGTTADEVAGALDDDDPLEAVGLLFAGTIAARAEVIAETRVTGLAGFTSQDVASTAGKTSKVWNVTSSNSRHPELDGETVPLGEQFSNGLAWPGDAAGGADQTAGCACFLSFA